MNNIKKQVVVIGGGLSGLSTAFFLKRKNMDVLLLEKSDRIGGQIHSFCEDGFVFESGPNTGVVSYPEIVEMFGELSDKCKMEVAKDEAKKRLIWKGNKFHALPNGIVSAVTTPLFKFSDKLRILGEPWRKKGDNPNESVAKLAARRLGKSFLDYAVDPFLSGVYAGDPNKLITRFALPKLYNLEQNYGSFIKGSIAKSKEPKSDRDRLATKKVFSASGGLNSLVDALGEYIGMENILTNVSHTTVTPCNDGKKRWKVCFKHNAENHEIETDNVITTAGSYCLPEILPFIEENMMKKINNLFYAPVVQAAVCYKNEPIDDFQVFGGLVPSSESRKVLGILNPSACFDGRANKNGNTLAFFMGGVRHQELIDKTDEELKHIVMECLDTMLGIKSEPDIIKFFRHKRAIPQYEINSGERFEAISIAEEKYKGLYIKGNLCGGIGMADRIHQAYLTAESL